MKVEETTPYPKGYPRLMLRKPDNEVVLVGDRPDEKAAGQGKYQVTILKDGRSYRSDVKEEDYEMMPVGFAVTLTN